MVIVSTVSQSLFSNSHMNQMTTSTPATNKTQQPNRISSPAVGEKKGDFGKHPVCRHSPQRRIRTRAGTCQCQRQPPTFSPVNAESPYMYRQSLHPPE